MKRLIDGSYAGPDFNIIICGDSPCQIFKVYDDKEYILINGFSRKDAQEWLDKNIDKI